MTPEEKAMQASTAPPSLHGVAPTDLDREWIDWSYDDPSPDRLVSDEELAAGRVIAWLDQDGVVAEPSRSHRDFAGPPGN